MIATRVPRPWAAPPPGRSAARAGTRGRRAPWPLAVAGIAIGLLALLPLIYLVVRSLGADAATMGTVLRERTVGVVLATLALGAVVGVGTVAIGVPVAWLTTRTDLPWRRGWAVLLAVPLAIPSYVVAFAFLAFFGQRGTLQGLLTPFGVDRLPSIGGLFGASLVLILVSFPYVTLATRAALLRLDPSVEESARLLGDAPRTVFRRVTLPFLVPAIGAGALLAVLYAMSDFGAVSLLQFDSLSRAIYLRIGASFDRTAAAILSLVLVGMTFAVTWGESRLRERSVVARGGPSVAMRRRPPARVPLGRWRWPAIGALSAIAILALAVPVGTIAWWLVRGLAEGARVEFVLRAAVDTFTVGAMAAALTVVLAIPVALLGARYASPLSRAVESSVYAGYALPGIVVALAMVFLATRTVPFLYQTLALLVAVYAFRFLPQALGGLRASLASAGTRLEEAGRTLGDGPTRAFLRLTVPYARPALVAGAALVFLTVVKELPLALLLAPIGFDTLATDIWDAASAGFYAQAAAPAALLLVLSVSTVAVLLRTETGAEDE